MMFPKEAPKEAPRDAPTASPTELPATTAAMPSRPLPAPEGRDAHEPAAEGASENSANRPEPTVPLVQPSAYLSALTRKSSDYGAQPVGSPAAGGKPSYPAVEAPVVSASLRPEAPEERPPASDSIQAIAQASKPAPPATNGHEVPSASGGAKPAAALLLPVEDSRKKRAYAPPIAPAAAASSAARPALRPTPLGPWAAGSPAALHAAQELPKAQPKPTAVTKAAAGAGRADSTQPTSSSAQQKVRSEYRPPANLIPNGSPFPWVFGSPRGSAELPRRAGKAQSSLTTIQYCSTQSGAKNFVANRILPQVVLQLIKVSCMSCRQWQL